MRGALRATAPLHLLTTFFLHFFLTSPTLHPKEDLTLQAPASKTSVDRCVELALFSGRGGDVEP